MLKRVLALDVGEKRIGIAIGNSDVKIAVPNGVIENGINVINDLMKVIKNEKIDVIVVGLPRNSQGQETKQSQFVREFSKGLSGFGLPIVFQDESLTSVEAKENVILTKQTLNRDNRIKGMVDERAAAIILTDYLEANFGK